MTKRISQQECVETGGHCWLYAQETKERRCRHCSSHQKRVSLTEELIELLRTVNQTEREDLLYVEAHDV